MTLMQQSSKADDRPLADWFHLIRQGMIKLPRFQRFEAWDCARVTSFLNTIISNLPVGVALTLEVGDEEKFVSRYIATAEPMAPARVTQHLLDGQQRLTSLWRALHNNYPDETYFVYLPQFAREAYQSGTEVEVRHVRRRVNKSGKRVPLWADDPVECLQRGMVPTSLLRPGDIASEVDGWLDAATQHAKPNKDDPDAFNKLEAFTSKRGAIKDNLNQLRERVAHFNLPFLSLPASTPKDVALQVFINMNTNSKPLTLYDIIVAEVENIAEASLHDLEAELNEKHPDIAHYGDTSTLILAASALLQDKLPNMRGMVEMDKQVLLDNWPKLQRGLARMAAFLEGQGVFDAARLPTNAVLAVIAAAYDSIPEDGDFLAKAERLLRRYLWSAFFTDRYENSTATRAFADFRAIKALLERPDFADAELASVPLLNRSDYPLASLDSLIAAGWPKKTGIDARAILAVTTYLGAIDFADGRRATYDSIQKREYHHVFPDALLSEAGIQSYLALNCALITWKTNRTIGRKDPLEYLHERVEWASKDIVRERLRSHLIDYDLLAKDEYKGLAGDALKTKLQGDFDAFLRDRAERVFTAMQALVAGDAPTLDAIWIEHPATSTDAAEQVV